MIKITSDSASLTKKIAADLIAQALKESDGPFVFLLQGDLGSGKTTFALGALAYFGIRPHAASPTFVIMKHYQPKTENKKLKTKSGITDIYHVDAYRLRSKKDLNLVVPDLPARRSLGEGGIRNPSKNSLFFIEWPEMIRLAPAKGAFVISFAHGRNPSERIIEIRRK